MNMKKTVAGLAAGVVALSAMASTVSAKNELTYTEEQKAQNKVLDFTSTVYKVTWDAYNEVATVAGNYTTQTVNSTLTFKLADAKNVEAATLIVTGLKSGALTTERDYAYNLVKNADGNWQITIVPVGTAITSGTIDLKAFTTLSAIRLVYKVSDSSKAKKADADTLAGTNITTTVSVTPSLTAGSTVASTYTVNGLVFTAPSGVTTVETAVGATPSVTKSTDGKTLTVIDTVAGTAPGLAAKLVAAGATVVTAAPYVAAATAAATVPSATFTVAAADTAVSDQFISEFNGATLRTINGGTVADASIVHGFTVSGYHSKVDNGVVSVVSEDSLYVLNQVSNAVEDNANAWNAGGLNVDSKGGAYKNDVNIKSYYNGAYFTGTSADVSVANKNTLNTAKVGAVSGMKLNNLLPYIQTMIGDAKGATVTFGLYDGSTTTDGKSAGAIDLESIAKLSSASSADDFSIALNYSSSRNFKKGAVRDNNKFVFNWDDLKSGLAAGTIYEMAFRVGAGKTFTIDTITIDVPAKTLADLSAGESVADTAASIAAPAASESVATEAAKNPTTGNAPIALAVIPVAIIAAAVIAKKRG